MPVERFPVEASHILMFARSVGDPNLIYQSESYAAGEETGGIIAPPTFVQASAQFDENYRLRPKIGEPWLGSGKDATGIPPKEPGEDDDTPTGMGARGLHAEQHYEYHRHIRPGDVLSSTVKPGESWEKQSKRAGLLKFSETVTEYRDQTGELVITARSVGVQTEKAVEG